MNNVEFFGDDMVAVKSASFPDAKATLYRLKANPDEREMDEGLFNRFCESAYSHWQANGKPKDCRVNFGSWWRIVAHG